MKGYNDVLNQSSKDYATAMLLKYPLSSGTTPLFAQNPSALPKYINPQGNTVDESTYDPINNQISLTNQAGTDWWGLITRTAQIHKHSISLSGGNDKANFAISGETYFISDARGRTLPDIGTIAANLFGNIAAILHTA